MKGGNAMEMLGIIPMIEQTSGEAQGGDSDIHTNEEEISSFECDQCYIDCDE